jgi:hypothetical protein
MRGLFSVSSRKAMDESWQLRGQNKLFESCFETLEALSEGCFGEFPGLSHVRGGRLHATLLHFRACGSGLDHKGGESRLMAL